MPELPLVNNAVMQDDGNACRNHGRRGVAHWPQPNDVFGAAHHVNCISQTAPKDQHRAEEYIIPPKLRVVQQCHRDAAISQQQRPKLGAGDCFSQKKRR